MSLQHTRLSFLFWFLVHLTKLQLVLYCLQRKMERRGPLLTVSLIHEYLAELLFGHVVNYEFDRNVQIVTVLIASAKTAWWFRKGLSWSGGNGNGDSKKKKKNLMLFNVTFSEISPDFLYKIVPASLTVGPLPCLNFLHHTYHHPWEVTLFALCAVVSLEKMGSLGSGAQFCLLLHP